MNPNALSQSYQQQQALSQNMTNQDLSNAGNYQGQYNSDVGQSQAANQNLNQYAQYMQGAGSGQNVYNQELGQLTNQFDPNIQGQLAGANKSLFGLNGALNGATQAFSQPGGVGSYGLSAPALAGYENSVTQPLQQGVQNANTQVGTLNTQLGTLMGGANQAATSQVQSEQTAQQALQNTAANALSQQQQAQSQMQFYSQLAQTQQGLTASQAAAYAQAQAAFQNAQAALTSASAAMKTAQGSYASNTASAALTKQQVAANQAYMQKYGGNGGVFSQAVQPGNTGMNITGGGGAPAGSINLGGGGGSPLGAMGLQ